MLKKRKNKSINKYFWKDIVGDLVENYLNVVFTNGSLHINERLHKDVDFD